MRLPKTSRGRCTQLGELILGKGDYVAGGSWSLPFLDLDDARRRRPLIFGEMSDRPESYPDLLREMFSGRQNDPEEWSVMWKEIGADGIWIDLNDGDTSLVERIVSRTRLPVAVTSDPETLFELSGIRDSTMILIGRDGTYDGDAGDHAVCIVGDNADSLSSGAENIESSGCERIILGLGGFDVGSGLEDSIKRAEEVRSRALSGEHGLRHPTIASTVRCWERGFRNAREASMWEAEAALSAMLSGTDIIIMRGPGAADMARVYGEELADL